MVNLTQLLVGLAIAAGVLLLVNWAYRRARPMALAAYHPPTGDNPLIIPPTTCVAPPPLGSDDEPGPCKKAAQRSDLYPGSYPGYALYNTGALGSPRTC